MAKKQEMPKPEMMSVDTLVENENNPRFIRDAKFQKLCQSIKDFPQMLFIRPIVINEQGIVLGGNMRLKACKEIGIAEVPVIRAENLTPEQQSEFIIKDNVGFGEWNFEVLANEWDEQKLIDWGMDVPSLTNNGLFDDNGDSEKEHKFKIVLEYTEENYNAIIDAFAKHGDTKENVVARLLGI